MLVEQGAKYSDMEYEIILNLHSRSQAVIDKEASRQRLAKLKEILRELRVNQQTQVIYMYIYILYIYIAVNREGNN